MKRLPAIPANLPVELRNYLHNLQEIVEQQRIQHTPPLERAATLRDLLDSRIANLSPDVQEYIRRTPRGVIQGRMLRPSNAFTDAPGSVRPDKFFVENDKGKAYQAFVATDDQLYPLGSFSQFQQINWSGSAAVDGNHKQFFSATISTPTEALLRFHPFSSLSLTFFTETVSAEIAAQARLEWRGGGNNWQMAATATAMTTGERWQNLALPVTSQQNYPGGAEFRISVWAKASTATSLRTINGFFGVNR